MSAPAKTWDLTVNNYDNTDIDLLKSWSEEVNTMVVSKEVGESGTRHLQGRITFKRAYRLTALKKLHGTAHWEATKATQDSLYCMKQGSEVIINISNKRQGKRTDLDDAIAMAEGGATAGELWRAHPKTMVRYSKGILKYKEVINAPVVRGDFKLEDFTWAPIDDWSKSQVISGPPGCGKTQFALAHFDNPLFVRHLDDLKKLDGHDGIVFDDMKFRHLPRESQIHLADIDQPSSIHLRFENALIPANMKKIFTTNEPEGMIFDLFDSAISRRVTVTEVSER